MISQSNHMMSVAKRWCWSRNGHTQNWLNTGVTTKIILKSSRGLFTLHDESTWIWWIRIGMWLLSCHYVKPLSTDSYSKIFRPENCRNPTTLLHWHESHFNSESRKWNNFWCLSKILTLELQHKHPWTTLMEHSLFFSVGEYENEKCKSQKTAVLDGTPFENWSYYRLRMTKWVNILIKWQDLIKTWESVLRVSHTERQRVGRASCAHQTLITRHTGWLHLYLPQKSHLTLIPGLGFINFLLLGRSPTFAFQHRQRFSQLSILTILTPVFIHLAENGLWKGLLNWWTYIVGPAYNSAIKNLTLGFVLLEFLIFTPIFRKCASNFHLGSGQPSVIFDLGPTIMTRWHWWRPLRSVITALKPLNLPGLAPDV